MPRQRHPWTERQEEIIRTGWLTMSTRDLLTALRDASNSENPFNMDTVRRHAHRTGLPHRSHAIATSLDNAARSRWVWSDARDAALREIVANNISASDGLVMLNRLPGKPIKPGGMRKRQNALGLKSPRKVRSDKGSTKAAKLEKVRVYEDPRGNNFLWASAARVDYHEMEPGAEDTAHAKRVAKQEKARDMLRREKDPSDVREATGLPMREVYRIGMEVREQMRAERRIG